MIWVIVFAAIALAGLLMLVGYAIWLAHKASDVFSELRVLADRSQKFADTLARIEVPAGLTDPGAPAAAPAAEQIADTPGRTPGNSPGNSPGQSTGQTVGQSVGQTTGHTSGTDDPDQNATRYTARRAADDVG